MSQTSIDFDETVTDAVECARAQLGDADAVEAWLQERREPGGDGRVEEALAYLRYRREEGET